MFNQKGVAVVPIIILLVVGVVIVGAVWYTLLLPKTPAGNTNTSQVVTNTNTAANTNTTADDTAGWKTYTNSAGGYSIRYPSEWLTGITSGITSTENPAQFFDERAANQTELMMGTKIEIYYEDSQATSLKEAVGSKDAQSSILSETDITLDSIPAVRRSKTGPLSNYTNVVYVIFNKKLISIVQYIPEDEKKDSYTSIFNQILSTFQFLDDTTGWKTYKNGAVGYSLLYPADWSLRDGESVFFQTADNKSVVDIRFRDGSLTTWFDTAPVGDITLGGRSGKKFVYRYCDGPSCGADTVAYVVQHRSKLLGLEFIGDKQLGETEQTILSTFQFTD